MEKKVIKVMQLPLLQKQIITDSLAGLHEIARIINKPVLVIEDWQQTHQGIQEETGKDWRAYHVVDGDVLYTYYQKKKGEGAKE